MDFTTSRILTTDQKATSMDALLFSAFFDFGRYLLGGQILVWFH